MRRWIGLVAAIVGILVMVLAIYGIGRGVLAVLNGMGSGGGEPDPMYDPFPSELSRETRPPELLEDETAAATSTGDPSLNWIYDETTPVDKTADELSAEMSMP